MREVKVKHSPAADPTSSSLKIPRENLLIMLNDFLPNLVEQVIREIGFSFRNRIFNPLVTIQTFLFQILSKNHACKDSVINLAFMRMNQGKSLCSILTGAYCRARSRLPLDFYKSLSLKIANVAQNQGSSLCLWKNREVILVDGTGISMPDTKKNADAFSPLAQQKNGVNFPLARLVFMFSLSSGSMIHFALAAFKGKETGETSLLNKIMEAIPNGSIILGDSAYANYWIMSKCLNKNIDCVFDFRPSWGKRLKNKSDQIISLSKPKIKGVSQSVEEHESLPDELRVRIIKIQVCIRGFRPKTKYIVTTLYNENLYSHADLASLYRKRWQVELHIREVKHELGLGICQCKSPDMVMKELYVGMMSYNIIQMFMHYCFIEAGFKIGGEAFKISFTVMKITILELWYSSHNLNPEEINFLLLKLLSYKVGKRPYRYEPRALKRRGKPYKLLTATRAIARERFWKKISRVKKKKA